MKELKNISNVKREKIPSRSKRERAGKKSVNGLQRRRNET